MKAAVWIICTMDTKFEEGLYLKARLEEFGLDARIADVGAKRASPPEADVSNIEIAAAAGFDAEALFQSTRRMDAIECISKGLRKVVLEGYRAGELGGVIAIGGSGGMSVASDAICALPFGVPKIMVTSVASGDMRPYIKGKDVMVLNPVADISGLNVITRKMLLRAASAMSGMQAEEPEQTQKSGKAVAITGFGSTDPCVNRCRRLLEERGYETVTFHARGVSGGTVMEELIGERYFCGILDITTTEIADLIAGGVYPAEPERLDYLASGPPAVVAPGALDMVNFGVRASVPAKYDKRRFVVHGIASTLMRTEREDMLKIADFIAEKFSRAGERTLMLIPEGGFSSYDAPGHDFYAPETNRCLIEILQRELKDKALLCPQNINETQFADLAVEKLIFMMEGDA